MMQRPVHWFVLEPRSDSFSTLEHSTVRCVESLQWALVFSCIEAAGETVFVHMSRKTFLFQLSGF